MATPENVDAGQSSGTEALETGDSAKKVLACGVEEKQESSSVEMQPEQKAFDDAVASATTAELASAEESSGAGALESGESADAGVVSDVEEKQESSSVEMQPEQKVVDDSAPSATPEGPRTAGESSGTGALETIDSADTGAASGVEEKQESSSVEMLPEEKEVDDAAPTSGVDKRQEPSSVEMQPEQKAVHDAVSSATTAELASAGESSTVGALETGESAETGVAPDVEEKQECSSVEMEPEQKVVDDAASCATTEELSSIREFSGTGALESGESADAGVVSGVEEKQESASVEMQPEQNSVEDAVSFVTTAEPAHVGESSGTEALETGESADAGVVSGVEEKQESSSVEMQPEQKAVDYAASSAMTAELPCIESSSQAQVAQRRPKMKSQGSPRFQVGRDTLQSPRNRLIPLRPITAPAYDRFMSMPKRLVATPIASPVKSMMGTDRSLTSYDLYSSGRWEPHLQLRNKPYDKAAFSEFLSRQRSAVLSRRAAEEREWKMTPAQRLLHRQLVPAEQFDLVDSDLVIRLISPRKCDTKEHKDFLNRQGAAAERKVKRGLEYTPLPRAIIENPPKKLDDNTFKEFIERQQEAGARWVSRCLVPQQKGKVIRKQEFAGFLEKQEVRKRDAASHLERIKQDMLMAAKPGAPWIKRK